MKKEARQKYIEKMYGKPGERGTNFPHCAACQFKKENSILSEESSVKEGACVYRLLLLIAADSGGKFPTKTPCAEGYNRAEYRLKKFRRGLYDEQGETEKS